MPNVRTASRATTLLRGVAIASAVLAAGGSAARPVADKGSASEKAVAEIKEFEERFNKAYEANDLRGYFDFYTSDMTQFYQQGRLDLPDYRKLWEKEVADGGGMEKVTIADMAIQIGPSLDAAVAAYRIFTRQRHPGGAATDTWNQETDVLFKRDGRWKVAHVHYSDAPKGKS